MDAAVYDDTSAGHGELEGKDVTMGMSGLMIWTHVASIANKACPGCIPPPEIARFG